MIHCCIFTFIRKSPLTESQIQRCETEGNRPHSSDSRSLLPPEVDVKKSVLRCEIYRKKWSKSFLKFTQEQRVVSLGGCSCALFALSKSPQREITGVMMLKVDEGECCWTDGGVTCGFPQPRRAEECLLGHKWKSRAEQQQSSENVGAQIQFSSHRRHCVSLRGRLGEWLHQYSGVCMYVSLRRQSSLWGCLHVRFPLNLWHKLPLSSPPPVRSSQSFVCDLRWRPVSAQTATSQEILHAKCNRNAKRRDPQVHTCGEWIIFLSCRHQGPKSYENEFSCVICDRRKERNAWFNQ